MNDKRIMLVGRICGNDFSWDIAPLPSPAPPMTDANPFVSRYMNSVPMLATPNNLFWDGFYAQVEGQPLASMPTEQQEVGWWHALNSQAEAEAYEDDMIDREYWARGGW